MSSEVRGRRSEKRGQKAGCAIVGRSLTRTGLDYFLCKPTARAVITQTGEERRLKLFRR